MDRHCQIMGLTDYWEITVIGVDVACMKIAIYAVNRGLAQLERPPERWTASFIWFGVSG